MRTLQEPGARVQEGSQCTEGNGQGSLSKSGPLSHDSLSFSTSLEKITPSLVELVMA